MIRAALLEELATRSAGARRIAVDGPDAAGKTTLADELADVLTQRGEEVARVTIDDFLLPADVRYRLGWESPEGYYRDSFDHRRFSRAVLAAAGIVVADGVFLQRPELAGLWDFVVFVDASEEETLRRAAARDASRFGDGVVERYRRRYLPAQRAYRGAAQPVVNADVVVDNTDPRIRSCLSADRAASAEGPWLPRFYSAREST